MTIKKNACNGKMKSTVKKGVILAAGYGTRFFPATKTVPKEMLPIIDVPSIEYIVREFVDSGISKILLITSRRKKALEDYFDREVELEWFLSSNKKSGLIKKISGFKAEFTFIRQSSMTGTGDALKLARDFTGGEPFVVAYPDDVIVSEPPLSSNLISAFMETGKNAIAIEKMPAAKGKRYGVVYGKKTGGLFEAEKIVEKPETIKSGSVMVSIGRYLFTSEIFDLLKSRGSKRSAENNSQTVMLNTLAENSRVVGVEIEGARYDLGQPDGYVKAITHAALQREDIRDDYIKYLKSLGI